MFTRTTGFVIVPVWMAAMAWLIVHDVVPAWTALPPPAVRTTGHLGENANVQYVLSDASGPIGRIWTTYLVDDDAIRRDDCIWIERSPFEIAPLRVSVTSVFTVAGDLDEVTVLLDNADHRLKLHGERFDSDFSFLLTSGVTRISAFKVPIADGAMITGALNPFSSLPDLRVGQRWRMQVFNPFATLLPLGDKFVRVIAEVTHEERIKVHGKDVNCLVVQAPNVKAWATADGAVLKQALTLPVIGELLVEREESFDREAMTRARHDVFRPTEPAPKAHRRGRG